MEDAFKYIVKINVPIKVKKVLLFRGCSTSLHDLHALDSWETPHEKHWANAF